VRTPLTFYGGKQKLAAQIVALMPSHTAYMEPFAGGAAVLFAKPRAERETLNDLDGQIMAFWRALRDRPEELASAVSLTPYSRTEWQASRDPAGDDIEAARRLLVNVDHSFSRSRDSWSPPSLLKDRKGRWQPRTWEDMPRRIRVAAGRLSNVCLECGDAVDMTGYPNDEVERLGWRSVELRAQKNVQTRAGGKLPAAPETLWLSPAVVEAPNLFSAQLPETSKAA
jgi:DNA adenine methylase